MSKKSDGAAEYNLLENFAFNADVTGDHLFHSSRGPISEPLQEDEIREPLDRLCAASLAYNAESKRLANAVLELLALALDKPRDFFVPYMSGSHSLNCLRLLNYPHISDTEEAARQYRINPHADFGLVTLLEADKPGLEVQLPATGEWVMIENFDPSAFTVNVGNLVPSWFTSTSWKSTRHRIRGPEVVPGVDNRRQSVVFFVNPDKAAVMHPDDGSAPFGFDEFFDNQVRRMREGPQATPPPTTDTDAHTDALV